MNLLIVFLFWAVMVVIAIVNGYFGQAVATKVLGPYGAHLYRVFVIIAVIFIFSNFYLGLVGGDSSIALKTGLIWLASSIIFEFGFGHFVFGIPWEKFREEYNIFEGRLWGLVLASEVIAPVLNAWLFFKK